MEVADRRDWREIVRGDASAGWAFRAMLALSVIVFVIVGRHQWFIRDDWALILTRRKMAADSWSNSLFVAQDGHWMTPPLLLYWLIEQLFGIDSYWPFLLANMALHVGAVLLVRELCRRVGVSEWTTVFVCTLMLQPRAQSVQTDGVLSRYQTRTLKRKSLSVSAPTGQMSITLPE